MSITFAHNEDCRLIAPGSARLPRAAIGFLCAMVTEQAARLLASVQHRWTMRDIARLSTHRLHDIGFERDWDGSLIEVSSGRVVGHLEH